MKRKLIEINISDYPTELRKYLENTSIYDSSCSPQYKTLYLQKHQMFLKKGPKGSMKREYENTVFLHSHNLAPEVVEYISHDESDYFITKQISGEDGIDINHINNPEKLAFVFGQYLRMLHAIPTDWCINNRRMDEIITEARTNVLNGGGDVEQLQDEYNMTPIEALKEMEKLVGVEKHDVFLHGDYCLPNIIMKDFKFSGFIDLDYGGVGDRYYDLFWGIWTLKFNLKTDKYKDIFLQGYGLDKINGNRMKFCGLLAGLTG